MDLDGRVVVATGAGDGIGAAMCRRFAAAGARVVVSDIDGGKAAALAAEIDAVGLRADAGDEGEVRALVDAALARHGRIDLLCANAGVIAGAGVGRTLDEGGPFAADADWERSFRINVMGQIYAIRAALPAMLERGEGYLLLTASAAGLLTDMGCLPYTMTKHASVGLAEWLSMTYGDRGIRVSCLCPQGVRTGMLEDADASGQARHLLRDAIDPDRVADAVVEGLAAERFLILPHPAVADFVRAKAADHDGWLSVMRRLRAKLYRESV